MKSLKVNSTKPLLLIFPFDLLSHYLRCLTLARHLAHHFEVRFLHSEQYSNFVIAEGYKTFHCKSLDSDKVMNCVKDFDFSWLEENALKAVYDSQVSVIGRLQPTVVLGDTSPTLRMAAEKTGVVHISLMNGYMSKYFALTRKISRTHPVYKYISIFSPPVVDLLTAKGEALAFYKIHRPFKKIRAAHKLSKKSGYLDELEGDYNLVCDLEALFPQQNLPANYFTIAPLYHDNDQPFKSIDDRLDPAKKVIFVSMGSTGEWEKLRFLNNKHFSKYNIVTAGDTRNVLSEQHFIKVNFINFHTLFPQTDLVICQGGNGTIYQALFYSIPVLAKTNNFEQEWNVDVLERVSAGASLDNIDKLEEYITMVDDWVNRKSINTNRSLAMLIEKEKESLPLVIRTLVGELKGLPVKDYPASLPS